MRVSLRLARPFAADKEEEREKKTKAIDATESKYRLRAIAVLFNHDRLTRARSGMID